MKLLHFGIELKSESKFEDIVEKINNVINAKLALYEGDYFDGDEVWVADVLGMWIQFFY